MNRLIAITALFLCMIAPVMGQYFIIDLDDQDPANRDITVGPIYEGNQLWAKSRHYSNGQPSDLEDNWSMIFELRYGQYDTNGAVQFPGTWSTSNECNYLNLTNVLPSARTWFAEIVGTHTAGYTKTFMQGTCDIEYSPGADTNMSLILSDWNATWWTNNVGAQVESNRLAIITNTTDFTSYTNAQGITVTNATLTESTSNSVTKTGRILEFTIDVTDSNAVLVAGTGGITMSAVTNGAVVTYTISAGAGTFTNAIIEGVDYTNDFTLASGTNTAINLSGGTNTFDLDIDEDVDMNSQDITSLGSSNVTISSGSYGGVEGFKISSGTNNYWLLLQEATGDTFSSLTIEGVAYTTAATINAGSNITIRTSGGAAFIDGVAAESAFGTVTNLNIEGSNYTANAILYAGSNVTMRTSGGTNFIDTTGTMTGIDIEGSNYTTSAILYAGSNTTIRTSGGTNFIDTSASNEGTFTNAIIEGNSNTNTFSLSGGTDISISSLPGIYSIDADAALTRDIEWDTTTEINAATTDEDFLVDSDVNLTVQGYSANLTPLASNNGWSLTNVDAKTVGGELPTAFQDASAALTTLAADNGNALTNLNLSSYAGSNLTWAGSQLNVNDGATAIGAYGSIYGSTSLTNSPDGTTKEKLGNDGGSTAVNITNNFSHTSPGRLTYLGTDTRIFKLTAAMSVIHDSSTVICEYYVATNGVIVEESRIDRLVGTGSDVGAVSIEWMLELSQNDYVEIWTDDDDINNMIITHALIEIMETQISGITEVSQDATPTLGGNLDTAGYTISGAASYSATYSSTNTCTFEYWTASNRWAMVERYGATTNVTFVSPE